MVRHAEEFRVAWVDTDASGRIHFTAPFRWVEATEVALYRRLGLLDFGRAVPRRKLETDYRRALRFEDEVVVELRVARVGRTSISYEWSVLSSGELAIKGSHTLVHVGVDGRPIPIPDAVRDALVETKAAANLR